MSVGSTLELDRLRSRNPSRTAASASFACLVSALILWMAGLPNISTAAMSDFGLASILTWQIWAAIALLAVGFSLSLDQRLVNGPLPLLHVIALVLVLHVTPVQVYETLRYSWAWKHLGIVDFIQRHGWVDTSIVTMGAYHNWPGFFLLATGLANLLELGSLELAPIVSYAPPVFTLLFLVALFPLWGYLGADRRQAFAASWIFITGNWVGQDYFSPQAFAYFLHLGTLALCLGPLRRDTPLPYLIKSRWGRWQPAVWFAGILRADSPEPDAAPHFRALAGAVALLLITAIIVSHQLTPIALTSSLIALVLIRRLGLRFVVFTIVLEALWLMTFASPFVTFYGGDELKALGQGLSGASERLVDTAKVSPGLYWVVMLGRAAAVSIALLAMIGGIRRIISGRWDLTAALLTISVLPLFANSYGGEILFRIYLFALPFLAFFAAMAFFPTAAVAHSKWTRAAFMLAALTLAVCFVFANNGKDQQYTFSQSEVAAVEWLSRNAPDGSLVVEGARFYPSQFLFYEKFTYVPLSEETTEEAEKVLEDPAGVLSYWLNNSSYAQTYFIVTRSQKLMMDSAGVLPTGYLTRIEDTLLKSHQFVVIHETDDARIFTLRPLFGQSPL
jgi:hypothetical protein